MVVGYNNYCWMIYMYMSWISKGTSLLMKKNFFLMKKDMYVHIKAETTRFWVQKGTNSVQTF